MAAIPDVEVEPRLALYPTEPALFEATVAVLRFLRLRDRLRCPSCRAVGTWKPHGDRFDREDSRPVRRWLCKCCGIYLDAHGVTWAYYSPERGAWGLPTAAGPIEVGARDALVPRDLLVAEDVWPWRG